uniref:Neurochondrin n=1 Tax=Fundulus heteroclitus TaxID=8078 RepID=A0A3Q2QXQ1_FUNHE
MADREQAAAGGGSLSESQGQVLDRCLHALRHAKNDSQTLAALLLITRLCPPTQLDKPTMRRILEAVGLNLPARLLVTAVQNPDGSVLPACELLSLGTALLAALSTEPDTASRPQLLATVPLLLGLLAHGSVSGLQNRAGTGPVDRPAGDEGAQESSRLDEATAADCFQVLTAVCSVPRGPELLLNRAAVPALCRAVDQNQTLSQQRALPLLGCLLSGKTREKAWRKHPAELLSLLLRLAKEFCRSSDPTRFQTCARLVPFLPPPEEAPQSEELKEAVRDVWAALRPMLQAKLTPKQIGPVLVLGACLLDLYGWEPVGPPKFCCLLVNRACVEVRMGLEEPPGTDLSPELQHTLTGRSGPAEPAPRTCAQNLRPEPGPRTCAQNLHPEPNSAQNLHPEPAPRTCTQNLRPGETQQRRRFQNHAPPGGVYTCRKSEICCGSVGSRTQTAPGDPCFRTLEAHLSEALPVLVNKPRLLVLAANYCTLGLMIGRLKPPTAGSPDAAQRRFFCAAVRLIGGALGSGSDSGPVQLSDGWAEAAELWRLSLQALGGCVRVQPGLVALIRDEGWLRHTLDQKRGSDETVSDYFCCRSLPKMF